jgi:hypothetical protein
MVTVGVVATGVVTLGTVTPGVDDGVETVTVGSCGWVGSVGTGTVTPTETPVPVSTSTPTVVSSVVTVTDGGLGAGVLAGVVGVPPPPVGGAIGSAGGPAAGPTVGGFGRPVPASGVPPDGVPGALASAVVCEAGGAPDRDACERIAASPGAHVLPRAGADGATRETFTCAFGGAGA